MTAVQQEEGQTLEDRKRAEFKKLMECKWMNGVPTEWELDEDDMQEAIGFLTVAMAEARHEEKTYIIKTYGVSKK